MRVSLGAGIVSRATGALVKYGTLNVRPDLPRLDWGIGLMKHQVPGSRLIRPNLKLHCSGGLGLRGEPLQRT